MTTIEKVKAIQNALEKTGIKGSAPDFKSVRNEWKDWPTFIAQSVDSGKLPDDPSVISYALQCGMQAGSAFSGFIDALPAGAFKKQETAQEVLERTGGSPTNKLAPTEAEAKLTAANIMAQLAIKHGQR